MSCFSCWDLGVTDMWKGGRLDRGNRPHALIERHNQRRLLGPLPGKHFPQHHARAVGYMVFEPTLLRAL
jgi:hypothetical protein